MKQDVIKEMEIKLKELEQTGALGYSSYVELKCLLNMMKG